MVPSRRSCGCAGTFGSVFVLDDRLLKPAGAARRIFLVRSLRALREQLGDRLLIVSDDPATVLPEIADAVSATSVHISADCAADSTRHLAGDSRRLAPCADLVFPQK